MSAWKRGYDDAYRQWVAGRWPVPALTESTYPPPDAEWRSNLDGFWQAVSDCRASVGLGRVTLGACWRLWRAKRRTGQ